MSGVAFEVDIGTSVLAFERLSTEQLELITYEIGALLEDQTKLRIADEKTAPEGGSWALWSRRYAKTRKPHHSLLVDQGNPGLLDSIQNHSDGLAARVGTNLVYGAIHQFGSEDGQLPARPYLGLSSKNRQVIEELVAGRIEELLQ